MPEKLQPTYVPFLDTLLGGGTATQGVYGILGPTGIGKTHLATMVACDGATSGSIFRKNPGQTRPWLLFDLESPGDMIATRVLSHCAKVRRENIVAANAIEQPYEQRRRSELINWSETLITEKSRLEHTKHRLHGKLLTYNADRLRQLNSGDNESSSSYFDVAEAVLRCISILKGQCNQEPGGIVIDGVDNVWTLAQEVTPLDEREFILHFVSVFCRDLSERYRCPVWVTHQVNGTACAASPIAILSHSSAARCRRFADSLDACFVLGTATVRNYFTIQCTKGNPDRAILRQVVLTHDQDFSSITEVKNVRKNRRHGDWDVPPTNAALSNNEELLFIDRLIAKLR